MGAVFGEVEGKRRPRCGRKRDELGRQEKPEGWVWFVLCGSVLLLGLGRKLDDLSRSSL